ncbi:MAG: DUF5320 domain-containing protein [Anaerolineae bacterium]|jgi:hypothetical protein|nr:DUF5320 domain-containing protein [Anaerolineae bacterium]MBT7073636.1 DUF5320 domain-containing protein [Anaerolineae bacterium]MBT7782328.1 DUF5320 domain-containing protein [Anaerolineae bacterium]
MPNRDQRGPNGEGPRSGNSTGNCAGEQDTGRFRKSGFGRGKGQGRAFRRGGDFGRGQGSGQANQQNSWVANQLNSLQSALQKLTDKVDKLDKE